MKSLLMVVDPLIGKQSVQLELALSIGINLMTEFDVSITSIALDEEKANRLRICGLNAISPEKPLFPLNGLLKKMDRNNESMVWLESWLREGLFGRNRIEIDRTLRNEKFDYVVNATNTVPACSDIWWIQGPPLGNTLIHMAKDNYLAKFATSFGKKLIGAIDEKITKVMRLSSKVLVANSRYAYDQYRAKGFDVKGIVHTASDFTDFRPTTQNPSRDFILAYVGKETELEPLLEMAKSGINVVAFGSKLPIGTKIDRVRKVIDYRGHIERRHLIELYTNALFTAFPFTNEPFGWIPIESMSCGTPVLTYNKQGPGETVVDGSTGWLVNTAQEFVTKAKEIWKSGEVNISSQMCMKRAGVFSAKSSAQSLASILKQYV